MTLRGYDFSLASSTKPKSAIQTSPGRGLIDQVQDFLFDLARPSDVQKVPIRPSSKRVRFGPSANDLDRR